MSDGQENKGSSGLFEYISTLAQRYLATPVGEAWFKQLTIKDPALSDKPHAQEEAAFYPGLSALAAHDAAYKHYKQGNYTKARRVSEGAHTLSGIDIHPGATLGANTIIDHGTGTVIGETAVIGDNTTIFHGVTLGGVGKLRDEKEEFRRHPKMGGNNTLSTGATILGPVNVGDNVVFGAGTQVEGRVTIGNNVRVRTGAIIATEKGNGGGPGRITIDEDATIGRGAIIISDHKHVHIGAGAIIEPGVRIVDKDVAPNTLVSVASATISKPIKSIETPSL